MQLEPQAEIELGTFCPRLWLGFPECVFSICVDMGAYFANLGTSAVSLACI